MRSPTLAIILILISFILGMVATLDLSRPHWPQGR